MKKIILGIIVVAVVVWAYMALTSKPVVAPATENPTTTTVVTETTVTTPATTGTVSTTNPATVTSSATVPATASVLINNFAFSPLTLTVKKGTTVTWTNSDGTPHTITSDSGTLLKSPTLSTGQTWSFTFNEVGTVSYHCSIHSSMKATVIVQN